MHIIRLHIGDLDTPAFVWDAKQCAYVLDSGELRVALLHEQGYRAKRFDIGPSFAVIARLHELIGLECRCSDEHAVVKKIRAYLNMIVDHWDKTGHHPDWVAYVKFDRSLELSI